MTSAADWERFLARPTEETFAPVYEATRDHVRAICIRRLGAAEGDDVEDAFQNAYARLLAWARSTESPGAPPEYGTADAAASRFAWLEADRLRQQRRRRKERPMDPDAGESLAATADVRGEAERGEMASMVRALLDELPEFDRLCLQLHYFDGMTHREIGLATATPQPTVSTRIRRALARLEQMARGRGLREAVPALVALAGAVAASGQANAAPAAGAIFRAATERAALQLPSLEVPTTLARRAAQLQAHGPVIAPVVLVVILAVAATLGLVSFRIRTSPSAEGVAAVAAAPAAAVSPGTGATPSAEEAAAALAQAEAQKRAEAARSSGIPDVLEGQGCCISVVGVVSRSLGGLPIPGASVRFATLVEGRDAGEPVTDETQSGAGGIYAATVRDGEAIFAVATAPGFAPRAMIVNAGPRTVWNSDERLDGKTPQLTVDFTMEDEAFLAGTVVGARGEPVPAARITLEVDDDTPDGKMREILGAGTAAVDSDASGAFRFGQLCAGPCTLHVSLGSEEWGPFAVGAPAENVELRLADDMRIRMGTVAGRVVDTNEAPVENAIVVWRSRRAPTLSTRTARDGTFLLENVPDEPGEVVAHSSELGSSTAATVASANVRDLVLRLELVRHAVFVGTVYKGDTDEPVSDFAVRDESQSGRRIVYGPDGQFRVERIHRGSTIALVIEAEGYPALKPEPIRINPAEGAAEQTGVFRLHPPATVRGRVIARGEPVQGVDISHEGLQNNPWREGRGTGRRVTESDAQGHFAFDQLPAGVHVFVAKAEGYMEKKFFVTMPGGDVDAGDIVLSGGSTLSVHVFDEATGRAIAGTPVEADPYWGSMWSAVEDQNALTDAYGMATFTGLFTSDHIINLQRHHLTAFRRVEPDETITLELPVGSARIAGRVLWGNQPVSGDIFAEQGRGTYGYRMSVSFGEEDGSYSLPKVLTAGDWTLHVTAAGDGSRGTLSRVVQVHLEQGEDRKLDIVFPANSIAGVVVDAEGKPVEGARVEGVTAEAASSSRSTTTDADGGFVLTAMAAGAATVTARHADKGEGGAEVRLVDGQLLPPLRIVLGDPSTGTIISCASRLVDGAPMTSAWVELFPLGEGGGHAKHSGGRDASGCMTVNFVPAGRYAVEVTGWGYSIARREIEIVAGETVQLDDVLYDAGAVRWTLRRPDGTGIANHPCTIRPADPGSISPTLDVRTNGEGVAIFRGLFPGNHVGTTVIDNQTLTASFVVQVREISGTTTTVPATAGE